MGATRLVTVALLCVLLSGCIRHKPVIYLDHAWSLNYAKNDCYLHLPQADRDPQLETCLEHQTRAFLSFERDLLAQLGAQPACAGTTIAPAAGGQAPPGAAGLWRLLLDLEDTDARREAWDLLGPANHEMHHGAGSAAEIAQEVCTIAAR